jgi:hypothetical protein
MKEEKKRILEENKAAQAKSMGYLKSLGAVILLLLFFSFVNKWLHKENPSPKPPAECVALQSLQSESEVENAVSSCWKSYFATYDTATSLHFRCRLDCRNISMKDIYTAVEHGELKEMQVYGCKNAQKGQGLIEPCLEIWGENGRGQLLCVIMALKVKAKKINFVTAYLKKGGPKCETDCDFRH